VKKKYVIEGVGSYDYFISNKGLNVSDINILFVFRMFLIAMSQIIHLWEEPVESKGSINYICRPVIACAVIFKEGS
jgi:hypothetical protein